MFPHYYHLLIPLKVYSGMVIAVALLVWIASVVHFRNRDRRELYVRRGMALGFCLSALFALDLFRIHVFSLVFVTLYSAAAYRVARGRGRQSNPDT